MSKYQSWKIFLLSTRNFAVGFIRTSWRTLHVHQSSTVTQPWEGCSTSDITTQESCCNYRQKPVAQKCKPTGKTFKQMASRMLELILSTTKKTEWIDIIFDVYRESYIKNTERLRRSSPKLNFSRIVSSQVIRHLNNFLPSSQNKIALIQFLCNNWKSEKYQHLLYEKQVYIAFEEVC